MSISSIRTELDIYCRLYGLLFGFFVIYWILLCTKVCLTYCYLINVSLVGASSKYFYL